MFCTFIIVIVWWFVFTDQDSSQHGGPGSEHPRVERYREQQRGRSVSRRYLLLPQIPDQQRQGKQPGNILRGVCNTLPDNILPLSTLYTRQPWVVIITNIMQKRHEILTVKKLKSFRWIALCYWEKKLILNQFICLSWSCCSFETIRTPVGVLLEKNDSINIFSPGFCWRYLCSVSSHW